MVNKPLDITEVLRLCAEESLSHSRPFAPPLARPNAKKFAGGKMLSEVYGNRCQKLKRWWTSSRLNLFDAMTSLELGDERMDCCEITPLLVLPTALCDISSSDGTSDNNESVLAATTLPPRVAPTKVNSGTPSLSSFPADSTLSSQLVDDAVLLVNKSLCPSLLSHWDELRPSTTSLLPILLLQLTALEAYVGTNNGGSSVAETLYCMTWCHDGVLADMARRLHVDPSLCVGVRSGIGCSGIGFDGGLIAARWILFASSLGVVRIAELARSVVVNADFYEEEDFGVALHGQTCNGLLSSIDCYPTDPAVFGYKTCGDSSSLRFCPSLQGARYCENVWETALYVLSQNRASCSATGDVSKTNTCTIEAFETIIHLQQSLYRASQILSNLRGNPVRDLTKIAIDRSRETVCLLNKLRQNNAVTELSQNGLVGFNGKLQIQPNQPELNLLLAASFDPFINRRLFGNDPVRSTRFRNPLDAVTSLLRLASELEWGVCDLILYGDSLKRIVAMLENNSLRSCGGVIPSPLPKKESLSKGGFLDKESPIGMNILSRSLIVTNLYFDGMLFGQYDFSSMVGNHMRCICAAPEVLLASTEMHILLAKPIFDTLKALCLNRHRERGFIQTILLPLFHGLQYEVATVDEKFRVEHRLAMKSTPSYGTNYVILNIFRLMERCVGLGIEFGLYPNWYDVSNALWCRDFLLSAMINMKKIVNTNRMKRTKMESQVEMETEKENEHQLYSDFSLAASIVALDNFEDQQDYQACLLHRNLCRGLVQFIAALYQGSFLHDPPSSINIFTSHKKRHKKRLEVCCTLSQTPPSLFYKHFIKGYDVFAVSNNKLLASAADYIRLTKDAVDLLLDVKSELYASIQQEEIIQIGQVCETNSLVLNKLALVKSNHGSGERKVSLEFNAHKLYFTLIIV